MTRRGESHLANLFVVAALGAVLFATLDMAAVWRAPFRAETPIDLSLVKLPQYALFSLARGWAAMAMSLIFAVGYASWAYYDRRASALLLPMLDILQSIPVLGFMPGLVLALIALFPTSNFGLELACVLMLFTAQVWNIVFSYYDSLKAIPAELRQMGEFARFSPFQRFLKLELPFAAQGLIYNGMVSMAGGWFFLSITEAFTLGNRSFQLPGLGSYMGAAIAQKNVPAQIAGVVAMAIVIVAMDRLVWWPLVVWSRRFKTEDSASDPVETTLVARLLSYSGFMRFFMRAPTALGHRIAHRLPLRHEALALAAGTRSALRARTGFVYGVVLVLTGALVGVGCYRLGLLLSHVTGPDWMEVVEATAFTFLRVLATLIASSLWTIPAGVWIGLNPRLARTLQPFIQFAASFPAPMIYPVIFGAVLFAGGDLQWGAIILMMLGAQWYLLFNVAAGAQSIPADMMACARVFQLRGWIWWRRFILPAIFPCLVTGWITAAGGAWNASIVAEFLQHDGRTYAATGIGSYISHATNGGRFPQLAAAIIVMALCVVALNRSVWKYLQSRADLYCRFSN